MKLRIVLALALSCAAVLASAQTFRGGIQGLVKDATGAALPGATVTVQSTDIGLVRTAITDSAGSFNLPELPPGEYAVTGTLTGFRAQTARGVRVVVSAFTRVDLALALGDVAESVDVSASVPLVD